MTEVDKSRSENPEILDAYVQYCDGIERNIDRRYAVNRFNFYAVGAFASAIWFLNSKDISVDSELKSYSIFFVSAIWLLHSVTWVFQILRFREVSKHKHAVAIDIESRLGVELLGAEAKLLKSGSSFVNYTALELVLPITSAAFAGFVLLFST